MKNRTVVLIAICSFAAVSMLTFIPIKAREWVMVLIWGWAGAFCLGYVHKRLLFSAVTTAFYQASAMTLARFFAGKWPVKAEMSMLETAGRMFVAALVLNCLLWWLGKLARRFIDNRRQAASR